MANIVGMRYVCRLCGSEFIVTKGGDGSLHCHGKWMQVKERTQPSSVEVKPEASA